ILFVADCCHGGTISRGMAPATRSPVSGGAPTREEIDRELADVRRATRGGVVGRDPATGLRARLLDAREADQSFQAMRSFYEDLLTEMRRGPRFRASDLQCQVLTLSACRDDE